MWTGQFTGILLWFATRVNIKWWDVIAELKIKRDVIAELKIKMLLWKVMNDLLSDQTPLQQSQNIYLLSSKHCWWYYGSLYLILWCYNLFNFMHFFHKFWLVHNKSLPIEQTVLSHNELSGVVEGDSWVCASVLCLSTEESVIAYSLLLTI